MSDTPLWDALRESIKDKPASWCQDAIRAHARKLERQLRIAELKNKGTLANNLCPDHRDKQTGKPCLACTIETLERHARALADATENLRSYRKRNSSNFQLEKADDLMRSCFKAADDWRVFCEEKLK